MADKDYRTEINPNIISGCFKLPRIQIPMVFEEGDWGAISFEIKTSKGVIEVTSSGYKQGTWKCRGNVPSLVAGGFIRPDWCPGLHGNNKTRQTVVFKNDIPWLIYGNHRGTALPHHSIVIFRISKNKFEVEVLATKEQREIISQSRKRWDERILNERLIKEQQEKTKNKLACYSNPILFKEKIIDWLDLMTALAIQEMRGEHEYSYYRERTIWIDEQSMQKVIQEVMLARQSIVEAVQKAKVSLHKRGPRLSIIKST